MPDIQNILSSSQCKVGLLLVAIVLLALPYTIYGQIYGSPFIENYNAKDYNASVSNFDIESDTHGRMYFANWNGLLRFDGSNWKRINVAEGKSAYELAVSNDGIIYVSSHNQIGYIAIDSHGEEYFHPLKLDSLDIDEVQEIVTVGEVAYFLSIKYLIKYTPGQGVSLLGTGGPIKYKGTKPIAEDAFSFNEELFVNIPGTGLCSIKQNQLELTSQGALLADEMIVATTKTEQGALILCASGNTYLFDKTLRTYEIFDENLKREIASYQPKCIATRTIGQHTAYLIGTFKNGIYHVSNGKATFKINQLNGLTNNEVRDLKFAGNSLWVSTQNGISKLTGIDSFTFWNTENEDIGLIWELFKHNETLYLATTNGLYKKSGNVLIKVGQSEERSFHLYQIGEQLYLNNHRGINKVSNNSIELLYALESANRTLVTDSVVFVMSNEGLKSLPIYKNELGELKTVTKAVVGQSFGAVHYKGAVWVSVVNGGLLKGVYKNGKLHVNNFTSRHGLPDDTSMEVVLFDGELIFATNDGFYEVNEAPQSDSSDVFIKNTTYLNGSPEISYPITDANGSLWYVSSSNETTDRLEKLKITTNGYESVSRPYRLLNDQALTIIYPDPDENNVIWIAGSRGLYRYADNASTKEKPSFQVLINEVASVDSVLFHGIYKNRTGAKVASQPSAFVPDLVYDNNQITFEFTATAYDLPELTTFSYFLDGFDKSWSGWNSESKKEYTNLDPGRYSFKVKAKDLYGNESEAASYKFVIKPPWYYQTWVIVMLTAVGGLLVWLVIVAYTRRLRVQKSKLETEVKRKTSKVVEQTKELKKHRDELLSNKKDLEEKQREIESQNQKLQQLNATKDKFFSIIGHDLKNPLHSLISFSNLLSNHIEHMSKEEIQLLSGDFDKSLKNAYNLLDNLLEWSRSQINQIDFKNEEFDLAQILTSNRELMESQARAKKLTIVDHDISSVIVNTDKNAINTVVRNLLSNAIKFTRQGGEIQLIVKKNQKEAIVSVVDNGIGMNQDVVEKIFRIDTKHVTPGTAEEKGTGLGLILCKEFIEKCNGRIWVESEERRGTTFSFSLPLIQSKGL